ncbi:sodium:solute symporter [Flaviramulus aquimarinus]|uniref:Sodium:solute symporter n=1 Tax=Flaviramulus aquimarinus TaxID=1170456 RepID=A0ABP9F1S0_9FLAO
MGNNQIIIILFGLLYFGFILYTRRKGDFDEYSVAGRGLGSFAIFASICASYLGPGWTMGLTREGFNNGMFMAYIAPVMGIAMIFVAIFLTPKIRKKFTNSYSIGDIVGGERSHNHPVVITMSGIMVLLSLSALVVAMSYAGGELINNVFGFSKFWSIVIITLIVMLYSLFGGIRATIQTDVIQFLHFAILIPVLALLIILSDGFSWEQYNQFAVAKTQVAFDASSISAILGLLLVFLTIAGYDPSIVSRYLASKNDKVAKTSTLWSGVFIALWTVLMIFIGTAGAYMYPQLVDNDQVLLHIAEIQFHGIFYGIFIIAMIGVVMSSQDTFLNNAGVSFAQDILPRFKPSASNKNKLLYSKAYTIFISLVAIVVANYVESALQIALIILDYYANVMLAATVFAIIKKNYYWQSAALSMASGFVSKLVWDLIGIEDIPSIFIGISFSFIAYLLTDFYFNLTLKRNNK